MELQIEFNNLPEDDSWKSLIAKDFLARDIERLVMEVNKSDKVVWLDILSLDLECIQIDLLVSNKLFHKR